MQAEIDTTHTTRRIKILGVNAAGEEIGNSGMCAGRVLPWLQDTPSANVWATWHVTFRDVVILDQENRVIQVYNLTEHSLADPGNYSALRDSLIDAAR